MSTASIISENLIKDLLPQKTPFVMVGHLLKFEDGFVKTGFQITEDNIFNENGFFNESGLLENMAQSIALHTSYDYYLRKEVAPIGYIGSIKNVQVHQLPKVGDYIMSKVRIIKEFMGVTMVEGEIFHDNNLILSAQMKTFLAPEE